MKTMNHTPTTLLRTDHLALAMNSSLHNHLPALEAALRRGVAATADLNRVGFYELEVGGNWYYIHIPKRKPFVYLIAAGAVLPEPAELAC